MLAPDTPAPLALFIDARDLPCLLVGGGVIAARKAQRLLAAGATVTVISPQLSAEMQTLQANYATQMIYHARSYAQEDLQPYKLVIAATDDTALNAQIARIAKAHSIWVNTIDPGHASTAFLPQTIDRNPIQIALFSGGASPSLMHHLQRYLHACIPSRYGELARLLAHFRQAIRARFRQPSLRRRFYTTVINGPIAEQVLAGHVNQAKQALDTAIAHQQMPPQGEVYLVGAGPGDPELLTLRAWRVLQRAEVVVYDRLINTQILKLLPAEAELLYVGKERNHHTCSQDAINQLLLTHAKAGKRVLRLKGGDPFIFGRGGEEMEALIAARIPFQVVPGITAALGCAAAMAIPLTHRLLANRCTFLTGHFSAHESALDWQSLSQPGQTLVFYMGIYNLQKICHNLLQHGMPNTTPVAVIQDGTLGTQKLNLSTLAALGHHHTFDTRIPGLVIIGETIRLSPHAHSTPPQ